MIIRQENFMAGLNQFHNSHQTFQLTAFPDKPEYKLLEFKQFSWLVLNWEHSVSTVKIYRGEKRTVNNGSYKKTKVPKTKWYVRTSLANHFQTITILGCVVVWSINIFVCALYHNTAICTYVCNRTWRISHLTAQNTADSTWSRASVAM